MTDKHIIIDGIDVSGCSYGEIEKDIFKCSCEYNVRSASMFCKDNHNCYYKQLKHKEQECEEFRKANDEKNELLAKLGCPTTATAKRKVFCLQEQLDQLKAENEHLSEKEKEARHYLEEAYKLKQAVTEIKQLLEDALDTDKTSAEQSFDNIHKAIKLCEVLDE